VSIDEVINSSILLEMLDEVYWVVVVVIVDLDISGIPHSSHVPEGEYELWDPVSISPIRDLDWRSPSDSAAELPMSARQSIKIPSMCGMYFIIHLCIQMPVFTLI